ncbi:MAG: helix-turn-helix transcriptional regulator [Alphaproteobacteria bacterium]|nr:helix-turn-helix transcriptional regulator [Alphaproteobacteria bacterium]
MKKQIEQMRSQAEAAEAMLKALANRHRLMILCRLIDGERPVGDLAGFLELRDSTVSQHLALLRKDGLVSTRRDGQTIWYALASEPVRRLVGTLYEIYCGPAPVCAPAPKKQSTRKGNTNGIHGKLRTR